VSSLCKNVQWICLNQETVVAITITDGLINDDRNKCHYWLGILRFTMTFVHSALLQIINKIIFYNIILIFNSVGES
jgi:hypothetical protein